jgi:UDP-3-O-[3-hydroxymyristoyl] glucosamine N-acyltransferase
MHVTLGEIARLIGAQVAGEPDTIISGISGIKEANKGDLTFLANPKYSALLNSTKASAVIVSNDITSAPTAILRTDNPSAAFTKVIDLFLKINVKHPAGVHERAVVSSKAVLGKNVAIGANVVIEDGVVVGDNTIIYSNSYVGVDTHIGNDCLIHPNVTLRERIVIGNHVIIHSGTVVGSDGFGYLTVDGKHEKIPQLGTVIIEDDVEIGANVTIDRARFDKTLIGRGTKIDNLVQIAHNVIIGKHCIIVAQVGISGSTVLGDYVTLAGQVGVAGHLTIGEKSVVMAQSGVSKSIPAGSMVFGSPAKPVNEAKKINACTSRLPELYEKVNNIGNKIKNIEGRTDEG